MGDKSKELCNWKPARIEKDLDKVRKIVARPRFVCLKCARAAADRKHLCKPETID
ncbi:MAG: hypothetical protein R6X25_10920 [Candidatus Krumholzibacteriia bacterium]